MSIEALILGKLHQRPEQRSSKSGRPFVTAKVRAAMAEGESVFVNVIAFSESAGAALLALEVGDAVALAGTLKPGAWVDRDGNARPSVDMVASKVLTVYGLRKKRDTCAQAAARLQAHEPATASEDFGQDDAWLKGGAA